MLVILKAKNAGVGYLLPGTTDKAIKLMSEECGHGDILLAVPKTLMVTQQNWAEEGGNYHMDLIEGDILDIDEGMICHQVNCQGVMGAGLALQIKKKWPHIYEDYHRAYRKGLLFLGSVVTGEVKDGLYVAHLCAQYDYGRAPGKVYTSYVAMLECLKALDATGRQCYLPYGMGCGLAGGDWNIVNGLIESFLPNAIIVKRK